MSSPNPQKPEPSTAASLVRAFAIFGAAIAALIAVIVAWALLSGDDRPAVASATRRAEPLRGVALYRIRYGFRICSRAALHNCTARHGEGERDRIYALGTIQSVPSCDTQFEDALGLCPASADSALSEDAARARCMAGRGVVKYDLGTVADPRDEHLPAGGFRLECDEGTAGGTFAEGI
jgi:hypothetical protein